MRQAELHLGRKFCMVAVQVGSYRCPGQPLVSLHEIQNSVAYRAPRRFCNSSKALFATEARCEGIPRYAFKNSVAI